MDFNTALNIALNTASGTPPFYAAETICRLRGLDPWGVNQTTGFPNWQAVIVEQLCGACIARELMPK